MTTIIPASDLPKQGEVTVYTLFTTLLMECTPLRATFWIEPHFVVDKVHGMHVCMDIRFTFLHAHSDIILPEIESVVAVMHYFLLQYQILNMNHELETLDSNENVYIEQIGSYAFKHVHARFHLIANDPIDRVYPIHEKGAAKVCYLKDIDRKYKAGEA